ncbi:MAG: hypothetical protein LBB43_03575 [Spirochaetaceae bacterium]|jgi:hypothetical protein|nr:hypothetical protein [Spirochaetaceae bacterium]
MIKEIKGILEEVVKARCPDVPVVKSRSEESRMFMVRKFPFVSLITNPGRFDDREAKTYRYYDDASQSYKQRYVRGDRTVPILLFCWAEGEDATDELFSRVVPAIPRKFTLDGFDGLILITGFQRDSEALRKDWEAIGKDISYSMQKYNRLL